MRVNKIKLAGIIIIMFSVILISAVKYKNSERRHIPMIFSSKSMLLTVWERYKETYLEEGTYRAIDRQRDNITTSEGQSYSMLRSVWLDDRETFDRSWKWTQDNLQIKNGYLFSWLFGQKSDGTYGILTEQNGQNTASDADTDIAVSLLFAYSRWKDPVYLEAAKNIISEIWDEEVIIINGKPYLAANNIEKNFQDDIVMNPSYLAPYAYRMFAEVDPDPEHDWNSLVDASYEFIEQTMILNLDVGKSANLPPNWVGIQKNTGNITVLSNPDMNTHYSYDALRTPWRIALDWHWYKEPRALEILKLHSHLDSEWQKKSKLASVYGHDGSILSETESPSMYGGSIGAIMAIDANRAKDMYLSKLQSLYNPDTNSWKSPLGYYDENWVWFGMALYHNELPNLWVTRI